MVFVAVLLPNYVVIEKHNTISLETNFHRLVHPESHTGTSSALLRARRVFRVAPLSHCVLCPMFCFFSDVAAVCFGLSLVCSV